MAKSTQVASTFGDDYVATRARSPQNMRPDRKWQVTRQKLGAQLLAKFTETDLRSTAYIFGNDNKLIKQLLNESKTTSRQAAIHAASSEIFDMLWDDITERHDPTPNNQYTQWIIRRYISGGIRAWEDMERTCSALVDFHDMKLRRVFKNMDDGDERQALADINKIETLPDLEELINVLKGIDISGNAQQRAYRENIKPFIKSGDVTVITHDDVRSVIILNSNEASVSLFRQASAWCTARPSNSWFDSYSRRGKLYVIWEYATDYLCQMHVEDSIILDRQDRSIDASKVTHESLKMIAEHRGTTLEALLIVIDPENIKFIENPSLAVQMSAVVARGHLLQHIKKPHRDVLLYAAKRPTLHQHIPNPSGDIADQMMGESYKAIKYILNPSYENWVSACEQDASYVLTECDNIPRQIQRFIIINGESELLSHDKLVDKIDTDLIDDLITRHPRRVMVLMSPTTKQLQIAASKDFMVLSNGFHYNSYETIEPVIGDVIKSVETYDWDLNDKSTVFDIIRQCDYFGVQWSDAAKNNLFKLFVDSVANPNGFITNETKVSFNDEFLNAAQKEWKAFHKHFETGVVGHYDAVADNFIPTLYELGVFPDDKDAYIRENALKTLKACDDLFEKYGPSFIYNTLGFDGYYKMLGRDDIAQRRVQCANAVLEKLDTQEMHDAVDLLYYHRLGVGKVYSDPRRRLKREIIIAGNQFT